jgi:hypothetical protein
VHFAGGAHNRIAYRFRMRQETVTIEGPRDFELDRDRSHPLTYTITWPEAHPAAGLALVIGGCGGEGETSEGKSRNTREYIAANCGLAAVTVDYHCIQTRPSNGGSLNVDAREHYALIGIASATGLSVADVRDIGLLAQALGQSGQQVTAYAKIKPGRGEYQNFGVLQAMDHLAVVGHLLERGAPFDQTQIFALGGSHGAYIAHLVAKIAPGVLAGIIDNSGYIQPPISYLGIGTRAEYLHNYNGVVLMCHVEGAWSYNHRQDHNFYDRNRDLIRDVAFPRHVQMMASAAIGGAMAVSMVNCAADELVLPEEKRKQAALFNSVGVRTKLQIVNPEDIDGVLFKQYVHSLNLSFKRLFARDVDWLHEVGARGSGRWGGSVEYPCVDVGYRFSQMREPPFVAGEVYDLFSPVAAECPAMVPPSDRGGPL